MVFYATVRACDPLVRALSAPVKMSAEQNSKTNPPHRSDVTRTHTHKQSTPRRPTTNTRERRSGNTVGHYTSTTQNIIQGNARGNERSKIKQPGKGASVKQLDCVNKPRERESYWRDEFGWLPAQMLQRTVDRGALYFVNSTLLMMTGIKMKQLHDRIDMYALSYL